MLKKQQRISLKKDFDAVFKKGRSRYGRLMGIRVKSASGESNRYGIIVSAKVSKKAVKRNRIKRQLKNVCRLNDHALAPSHDLVIVALPAIIHSSYRQIQQEYLYLLKQLRLLRTK